MKPYVMQFFRYVYPCDIILSYNHFFPFGKLNKVGGLWWTIRGILWAVYEILWTVHVIQTAHRIPSPLLQTTTMIPPAFLRFFSLLSEKKLFRGI